MVMAGNLRRLSGVLLGGAAPGRNIPRGMTPFPTTLDKNDFNAADFDGASLAASVWHVVGRYTVRAGQRATFGFGTPTSPENQGYLYIKIVNATPADLDGKLRFVITNPQGTRSEVVAELRTERLDGSRTDKTQMVPLPQAGVIANEDDRLEIQFMPDTAGTPDATQATYVYDVPVTIWQ